MTSYTAIPDADIDPESPGTTTLFTRIRDNPIAISEGAAGAPKIQTAAILDGGITNGKLQPPTAGTGYLICRIQEAEVFTDITTYPNANLHTHHSTEQHLGCRCLVAGTVTAYVGHRTSGGAILAYLRVLKNGSLVQEWSLTSTSVVVRQVNISVAVGDVIVFQQRANGVTLSKWSTLRIYSNNPNFAVA